MEKTSVIYDKICTAHTPQYWEPTPIRVIVAEVIPQCMYTMLLLNTVAYRDRFDNKSKDNGMLINCPGLSDVLPHCVAFIHNCGPRHPSGQVRVRDNSIFIERDIKTGDDCTLLPYHPLFFVCNPEPMEVRPNKAPVQYWL